MKILTYLLLLLLGTGVTRGAQKPEELRFFVVNEVASPGQVRVDLPNLSLVGYVSEVPDLTIEKIEFVALGTPSKQTHIDQQGTATEWPPLQNVVIGLRPTDAPRFGDLTERAIDKRILIRLGGNPLAAPGVRQRIDTPTLQISVGTDRGNAVKLTKQLKSLATK